MRVGTDATAVANGTFGELLQGVLPDGDVDFLVTLPVARWARASFRLLPSGPVRVFPAGRWKAARLAEMMLNAAGSRAGGVLRLDSDLPVGKGMASSSADLVATARAVGGSLGLDTSPAAIADWLRPIEPTDGVMYPGVVAFEHRNVRLRASLGPLPATTIVGLDEGGQLDSIQFNRLPKPYTDADKHRYADLLAELADAIRGGDLAAVGRVASSSCRLGDKMRVRPLLPAMFGIAEQTGALGVACAHSGTLLGLLFDGADAKAAERVEKAVQLCGRLPGRVGVHHSLASDERHGASEFMGAHHAV
ncbi:kinase [Catellatospora chokoriensis]|uniref:Kinase n=1 Tax=Catellatospora chokoriensis TaxID=310353 RepID=A0A8J3NPN6_9ACTN|nr:kinase [Catellatospora chokoriensis]GIF87656.1 kinase [Catellatospora chokoriensis]